MAAVSSKTSDGMSVIIPKARWMDLEPLEFERLRRTIRESCGRGDQGLLVLSHRAAAKALEAVEAGHEVTAIRILGLLLFGKDESLRRFLPHHAVAFQAQTGDHVKVDEVFHGPLLRILEELAARQVSPPHLQAVAEAMIHRDYQQPGAVRVRCLDGKTTVTDAEGVRFDKTLMVVDPSRNQTLAEAFQSCGILSRDVALGVV
jgi:ATP-dependent DNA helicase RecG